MQEKNNESTFSDVWPQWFPWVLLVVAIVLGVGYAHIFSTLPWTEDPSAWGSFGDYIGGLLNPLVSTLTLIVAIKVWKQQRVELEATKKALEKQAHTASVNRREQRFFDLMQMYQQTVGSFYFVVNQTNNSISQQGKSAMSGLLMSAECLGKIGGFYDHMASGNPGKSRWRSLIENRYKVPGVSQNFNHYFRVVFQILKDAEQILWGDADRHIRLFRAQLSQTELIVLGLFLWLDEDGSAMRVIAGRYGLLAHLSKGDLRDLLEKELPSNLFDRQHQPPHSPL